MKKKELSEFIKFIVSEANDKGGYVTTLRLVKFIYLIDVEYYRARNKPLTNLKWIFYKFGPFAFEIQKAGKSLGYNLCSEEFVSLTGKRGKIFSVDTYQHPPRWLNQISLNVIDQILEIWCDQETSTLLNYVYYQTEPMQFGVRNKQLDFSFIEKGTRFYEFNVPKIGGEVKQNILSSIREYKEEEDIQLINPVTFKDEAYFEFLKILSSKEIYE